MKNRPLCVLLITVILLSLVTACQKSASKSPASVSTPTSIFPTPLPGSAIDNAMAGTQTAQALANPTNPASPLDTAVPPTEDTSTANTSQPTVAPTSPPVVIAPTATKAVPTAIPVPSATPGRPATYTLQSGEFPFCIARRFNVSAADLLAENGLDLNSHPAAGTTLNIPQTGAWDSGPRALIDHPTTYTVSAGETIYSIACAFGDVDPNSIAIANGLSSPYTLTPGQVLNIP